MFLEDEKGIESNSNISETEGTGLFFAYIGICNLLSPIPGTLVFLRSYCNFAYIRFRFYWNFPVLLKSRHVRICIKKYKI